MLPQLFTTLLVSVIVIVGALTFFPALSLGPIVEHLFIEIPRSRDPNFQTRPPFHHHQWLM